MSRRRIIQSQNGELPIGYTRVKYLEGTGASYINTGCTICDSQISAIFRFKTFNEGEDWFCGDWDSSWAVFLVGFYRQNIRCGAFKESNHSWITIPLDTEKHSVHVGIDGVFIDSVFVQNTHYDEITVLNKPMLLFRSHHYNTGSKKDIYEWKIYDLSGNLIREFIPALDTSGKPCLFCTISKQPFYNVGTGEFGYELMDGTYVAPV